MTFQVDRPRPQAHLKASNTRSIAGQAIGRRALLDRFLIQVPMMMALVLGLQFFAAHLFNKNPLADPSVVGTITATSIVNILGILIYREFRRTPGTRRFAYILPSFVMPAAILIAVLIGFRLPYTNWLLLIGLGGGVTFVWLVNGLRSLTQSSRLYLVPSTRVFRLQAELAEIPTTVVSSPELLQFCDDGAVIADLREDLSPEWERAIAHAVVAGVPVYNVKHIQESLTGRVQIDTISENSFGSLVPSLSYLLLKRTLDLLLSVVALVVLAVPMALIAAAIRISSNGPAIYRHRRVGFRGREFETLKFRSMHTGPQDDEDRVVQMTVAEDPRITKLGSFLRRTRLDELPQLINVLRGEMSLIGPRPEARALSMWYYEHLDFYEYRHIVRPGITGWAQVNQGHVTELDDVYLKLQYDFYYIKHLSGWLDLLIAFRTLGVMMSLRERVDAGAN